jgi:hypothetical protein
MLIQFLLQHPQALPMVLKGTPTWVWGLLAALAALGLSQARTRNVSLTRMAVMPLAMPALSVWGMVSAFSHSPQFTYVLLAWGVCFALTAGLVGLGRPAAGARFDAANRGFHVPGSWLPLLLILAIFGVKYVVGADLAMQPMLAQDGGYSLVVAALYGVFSGGFVGRAARLLRLALPANAKPPAGPLSRA